MNQERPRLAPSVLSADFSRLGEQIAEAEAAGAGMIHFDVMDGHFVPNITFGPLVISSVRGVTDLPFDTHLMIENPERYISAFADAGSDIILVHPEVCPHLHRVLQQIHDCGAKAGVALNPSTPLSVIDYVLDDIDSILVMSVNPGFGGQKFIPSALGKIADCSELISSAGHPIWLGVDGGINADTAPRVVEAGAEVLIAGSSIFGAGGSVRENSLKLASSLGMQGW